MNNLDINTFDIELNDLKKKYIESIIQYLIKGSENLIIYNEFILNIYFYIENIDYISVETIFDSDLEFNAKELCSEEFITFWDEKTDNIIKIDNKYSINFFKEGFELLNNLNIEFKDINLFYRKGFKINNMYQISKI